MGSLSWVRGAWIILAQFLAAMTAAGIVDALFPGPLMPRMELGAGTSAARGFCKCALICASASGITDLGVVIETSLTAAFVFLIFLLASDKRKGAVRVSKVRNAIC